MTSSTLWATLNGEGREAHIDVVRPSPVSAEAERVEVFVPLLSTRR